MNNVIKQVDLTDAKSSNLVAFIHTNHVTLVEEAFCPNKIELNFHEIAILSAIKIANITKVLIREELEAMFHDTGVLLVKHDYARNSSKSVALQFDQFRRLQNEIEGLNKSMK
ncbi:hypothetical protein CON65_16355 [Bacillus pseudomycoides]|uniref:Uncharacterized protein n=1 Tax=Bacillus pseudomycoides TaxID=64104 RepID=A0AA91ZTF7_9BACI|nr:MULTISPECIES: hypothetical protein [Bacillus]PEB48625.1 hypothetical protein COO03_24130 [Bacillus sp. AFS098217]PED81578.1 hypothetical protein CON65_16355 [Bacillus pseudomycoides]PEU07656.1 hypothetical protein CN525_26540 [Bacillus sp. AFS014408]PEU08411.1 hypothetical protein CN524_18910 [Bacillus sp. AFS019443]PFW62243.1 hypothetical protein COL20_14255 [Bacillus sp. AFS075034]